MDLQQLPTRARQATLLGATELAARTGLSRPTLYRVLGGRPPRIDDLRELALACGFDIDAALIPVSDPLAAVAARAALGDPDVAEWSDSATAWRERLQRYVAAGSEADVQVALIDEAGRASAPAQREGSIHLRGDARYVDRLVSAGSASGDDWALSGWAALDAMEIDADAPTILWTPEPRRVAQLLADSFRPGLAGLSDLILTPAHPSVFAGALEIDSVRLVAPIQAHIDAVGLGEAPRSAALAHLRRER
ncbi:helix-turn-helix transcriptional regulator [Frigoribacterium sp. CFBP9039]|uniref:helix-turn-helix domain-containing protein n=1 Tax=Frigoribacterium sp. CFBP9029 TaxID=3096541 RepID=UPI002A6B8240|nr:helix-turn-helix transcriptional regulator [Frigoribacterium sp. CFBP9039]MDY0946253.1 helix-turn-helix transcriptional regulator [Frigoribacterium sp. CFBP9039]